MRRLWGMALLALGLVAAPAAVGGPRAVAVSELIAQGRMGAAVRAAQLAVRVAPGDAAARTGLAQALLEIGDAGAARLALTAARDRGAHPHALRLLMAHALLAQGHPQATLHMLGAAPASASQAPYLARLRLLAHAALEQWPAVARDVAEATAHQWTTPAYWTDLARINRDAGNLAGAYQALEQALKRAPNFGPALALGGDLARARYGLVASLDWRRRAVTRNPDNVRLWLDLAATLGDLGANRDMLRVIRTVQRRDPRNDWAFYFQAVMAARAGRFALAQSLLQHMGDRLSDRPAVQLLRGAVFIQLEMPDRALAALMPLVLQQPDNFTARRLLARAAWQAEDPAQVTMALAPLVARPDADGYALILAGRAAEAQGQMQAAVALLTQGAQAPRGRVVAPLAQLSDGQKIGLDAVSGATDRLRHLLVTGQGARARAEALMWRKSYSGDPRAHRLLGDVEAGLQNWSAAAAAYTASANLELSETTVVRLSWALIQMGQGAQAQSLWMRFLAQNPQNVSARLVLADAQIATGQWAAAASGLEILRARLGDHHGLLMRALSRAWLGVGDAGQARAYAQAARSDMPFQADIRVALARAELAFGNRSAARRWLTAALANPALLDRDDADQLHKQL